MQHEIIKYVRFRDDGLIMCTDRPKMKKYIWKAMEESKYFQIICEQISSTKVEYLDIEIEKCGTRIETRPYTKPTNKESMPLDPSSAHAPQVHKSWVRAELERRKGLAYPEKNKKGVDSEMRW
eukprot:9700354-Lingulodinium_polyedra.AAC.1